MDTEVMHNIDLFPATNSKAIDVDFFDNSSYIQQLSSISFWDNFDESNASSSTTAASSARASPKNPTSNLPTRTNKDAVRRLSSSSKCRKPSFKKEKKKLSFAEYPPALDCADYWLQFDSDDDSVERIGESDRNKPTTRRTSGLVQPVPKIRAAGPEGKFKLAYQSEDLVDDSALDHALSDSDEFEMAIDDSFMKREAAAQPPEAVPERLYSTPLSWEPPQPGVRMDTYLNVNQTFSDPERQRLLAIAMGTGLAPVQTNTRPGSNMDYAFDVHQSPTTLSDSASMAGESRRKNSMSKSTRSGQTTPVDATEKAKEKPKNSDRAAHNDIERKYRTNLKDRIAELREAIPSLRSIPEDGHDDGDSPIPPSRAPKVSKGTVLSKATEYIHQLERRNRSMSHKNEELTRRLQAFEQLLGATAQPNWQPQAYGAQVFNPRAYAT